jgi:hypothetical protein
MLTFCKKKYSFYRLINIDRGNIAMPGYNVNAVKGNAMMGMCRPVRTADAR